MRHPAGEGSGPDTGAHHPDALTPESMLRLQGSAGNRAVLARLADGDRGALQRAEGDTLLVTDGAVNPVDEAIALLKTELVGKTATTKHGKTSTKQVSGAKSQEAATGFSGMSRGTPSRR